MAIEQERALAHTYLKQAWFRLCVFDTNTSSAIRKHSHDRAVMQGELNIWLYLRNNRRGECRDDCSDYELEH